MIQGKRRTDLSPESVLRLITEQDIYRRYMPHRDWRLNVVTNSPFHRDDHPSFLIGNKHGSLYHIDFATPDNRGDCFDFVRQLFGISFGEALEKIDQDMGLGLRGGESLIDLKRIVSLRQIEAEKRYCLIQCETRPFTDKDIEWWGQYHITPEELRENRVYSIKRAYLNRQKIPIDPQELRFGYLFNSHWKLYFPERPKRKKWISNVPLTYIEGKQYVEGSMGKIIITKSKKDAMVLRKLFPATCSVQNEGIGCFPKENVKFFKDNSQSQVLSFDSDVPGVNSSKYITELFGFEYCNVPRKYLEEGIKDWADLAKDHGLEKVEEVLKEKNLI